MYPIARSIEVGVVFVCARTVTDGVEDDARIRGSGWSAVRDWRALRAERRLLALGLFRSRPRTIMSAA